VLAEGVQQGSANSLHRYLDIYRITSFVSASARGAGAAPRRASRRPAQQSHVIMARLLRSLSRSSTPVSDQQAAGSVRAIAHPSRRQSAVRYRPQSSVAAAGAMQQCSLFRVCARTT